MAYIGDNNGKAQSIVNIYIGDSNGVARQVIKAYIGDENDIARLWWGDSGTGGGGGGSTVVEVPQLWPQLGGLSIAYGYDQVVFLDSYAEMMSQYYYGDNTVQDLGQVGNDVKAYYVNESTWNGNEDIIYIVGNGAGSIKASLDCTDLFVSFRNLSIPITFSVLFDTSNVSSMKAMFQDCHSVSAMANFDTSSVIDMSYMFDNCAIGNNAFNFNTSNVKDMSYMFRGSSARYPEYAAFIANFNTSNVENMAHMFAGSDFETLDLTNWDTSKVVNMEKMFWGCSATEIKVSADKWDMSKADTTDMFYNCGTDHLTYV